MRVAFVDFETYYDSDYTLKKLSPGQYITDSRFQLISVSVRVDENGRRGENLCVFGEAAIRALLQRIDINSCMAVAHNMNGFDALILFWKLGFNPRALACTLSMARPLYTKVTNLGLGYLSTYLSGKGVQGLVPKRQHVIDNAKGKRLEHFSREELLGMAEYNREDTDNCAAIFYHLLPHFSAGELLLMDMTIRARCQPQFELNIPLLEEALVKEKQAKRTELLELAAELEITVEGTEDDLFEAVRKRLSSTPKFVELLESLGVDVPLKPSPKNAEVFIPALAKTDEGFQELLDSDDEVVVAACSARLSVKSTLLETRIGKLVTARTTSYALPLPYRMWGADTTGRWSGEEYNPQNLTRILKKKPRNSDALRKSIIAPDGFVVGVADQSSIELRVNHFLWKVGRSMRAYLSNAQADLYKDFAATKYAIAVEQVNDEQRQAGKVAHLGLGFGAGPHALKRVARNMFGLKWDLDTCSDTCWGWRDIYKEIPQGWQLCQESLFYMQEGVERPIDPWGLCHTVKDGIVLPSGRMIRYPHLRRVLLKDQRTGQEKWEFVYGTGRHARRIYGPKVDENIVQAIARDSVADAAVRFYKDTGYPFKLMTHDELGYLWPEEEAHDLLAHLHRVLRTPLSWWPELVLWSEGGVARSYADAK